MDSRSVDAANAHPRTPASGSPADLRDPGLIARASNGDAGAFEELLVGRLDRLFRIACAILGNEADAADATQDACLSAWRELPRLRDEQRFEAWLSRVLVNACRMRLRRRSRVREIAILPEHDRPADRADHPSRLEDIESLDRAFGRLDVGARSILVLHHMEHRPVSEIAAALGVPVGTLKWRLHEARKQLAKALDEEGR